ncbi:MAG: stage 0 sporulation family protein [Candidatus Sumerlaeia bacterium]
MVRLINVALNDRSFPLSCLPEESVELCKYDFCVVSGLEMGEAIGYVHGFSHKAEVQCKHKIDMMPRVIRRAHPREVREWHYQIRREREALAVCKEKAALHNLDMRISQVKFDDRQRKVIFYFTADKRVDFREMVKDLASAFRARIELWQIGVRDETRQLGGIGICGCKLCCSSWLKDFMPVSIRCAKAQDIPFSPVKLSGICGRLRCCLAYEHEQYVDMAKGVPPISATIESPEFGEARVVDRNLLTQTLTITDSKGNSHQIPVKQVHQVKETPGEDDSENKWFVDESDDYDDVDIASMSDDPEDKSFGKPIFVKKSRQERNDASRGRSGRRERDEQVSSRRDTSGGSDKGDGEKPKSGDERSGKPEDGDGDESKKNRRGRRSRRGGRRRKSSKEQDGGNKDQSKSASESGQDKSGEGKKTGRSRGSRRGRSRRKKGGSAGKGGKD